MKWMEQHPPQNESPKERDIRENKDVAAFSYIWIMSILVYYARKDSPFVQYHARQGIVLFILSIPLWFIPVVGQLFEFVILAGMVMGFINAFQGRYTDVPIIGPLAKGTMTPLQAIGKVGKAIQNVLRGIFGGNKKPPPPSPSISGSSHDSPPQS